MAAPDYVGIADGGDILSFARVGLAARTYMDAGAFGCLGVGVPFMIAAALAFPGRQVISVNGDGAFGNAMELDTAVRRCAKAVFIVANNAAWNIERYDQEANYGGRVVGTTLRHSDYAALARALGAHGERVEDANELPARSSGRLQRAGAGRRRHLAGRGVLGRQEGRGLRPGLPGAHRLGRGRAARARGRLSGPRPWTRSTMARSTTASCAPPRAGPGAPPTRCRRCAPRLSPRRHGVPLGRDRRRGRRPAQRYAAAGYGLGHRVAILFAQRPEFFFHYYALNALGCSVVPINPDYRPDEIA